MHMADSASRADAVFQDTRALRYLMKTKKLQYSIMMYQPCPYLNNNKCSLSILIKQRTSVECRVVQK